MTSLPVLGVPVESQALKGMDSLLSIVQMPAGVPVGTLAIGRAGAVNAGLLAASILATNDESAFASAWSGTAKSRPKRWPNSPNDRSAGLDDRHCRWRPARPDARVAAAQLGYKCHIFDPHERPCAADVAAAFTRARL